MFPQKWEKIHPRSKSKNYLNPVLSNHNLKTHILDWLSPDYAQIHPCFFINNNLSICPSAYKKFKAIVLVRWRKIWYCDLLRKKRLTFHILEFETIDRKLSWNKIWMYEYFTAERNASYLNIIGIVFTVSSLTFLSKAV